MPEIHVSVQQHPDVTMSRLHGNGKCSATLLHTKQINADQYNMESG